MPGSLRAAGDGDSPGAAASRARRLERLRGLYAIVDASRGGPFADLDPLALAEAYLRGGAGVIQLRLKGWGARALLEVARAISGRCNAAGALCLVNDRPDVAALAGADGVHLGQEDLPPEAARAVLGPAPLVGVSVHSDAEMAAARAAGADYVGLGPIFTTGTKAATAPGAPPLPDPLGLAGLARAARRAGLPLVAIGGITAANAAEVAAAGARCAAAISWLCTGGEPEARARAFSAAFAAGAAPALPREPPP